MQYLYEKIVKRRWRIADYLRMLLIVTAAIILIAVAVLFSGWLSTRGLSMVVPVFILGVGYGAYYLVNLMRIEYEYSYFQGEIDLDVITAKRKRKRLATVKVRDFEDFGKYSEQKKSVQQMKNDYDKCMFICSSPESPDCYYAVVRIDKANTMLVFEPTEAMLSEMKVIIPRFFRGY